jgi:DNA-binding SARP family transcriptional activator
MLGRFNVLRGESELNLTGGSQRLLAFLALHRSWLRRALIAGTLWPNASEAHAQTSLRSAISRLGTEVRPAVEVSGMQLRLASGVPIDLAEAQALARRLVGPDPDLDPGDAGSAALDVLSRDLLPGWYDEWALLEMEGWRQLRLHALEALADRLVTRHRFGDAAHVSLIAARSDPLRESPRGMLIRIHLAEGNQAEALREYRRFREQLIDELGIEPSAALQSLLQTIQPATGLL